MIDTRRLVVAKNSKASVLGANEPWLDAPPVGAVPEAEIRGPWRKQRRFATREAGYRVIYTAALLARRSLNAARGARDFERWPMTVPGEVNRRG